jgi:hypothetical protein
VIRFWPIPDGVYGETVRGYRKPKDWVAAGAGAVPDCPEDFHNVIAIFAIAKAFEQQQDPESSQVQLQHFEQEVNELHSRYMRDPVPSPMVFNGRALRYIDRAPEAIYPWGGNI